MFTIFDCISFFPDPMTIISPNSQSPGSRLYSTTKYSKGHPPSCQEVSSKVTKVWFTLISWYLEGGIGLVPFVLAVSILLALPLPILLKAAKVNWYLVPHCNPSRRCVFAFRSSITSSHSENSRRKASRNPLMGAPPLSPCFHCSWTASVVVPVASKVGGVGGTVQSCPIRAVRIDRLKTSSRLIILVKRGIVWSRTKKRRMRGN